MKKLIFLSLFIFQFSFATPVELDFPYYLETQTHLSPFDAEDLKAYHFVLVAGFTNEFAKEYLKVWKATLEENGISVTIIKPHSLKSVEENVPYLKTVFESLHAQYKKRLIVIGHSKGGLESLSTLLEYPQLAERVIDRLVAVQSPLCGCNHGEQGYNLLSKFLPSRFLKGLFSLTDEEVKTATLEKINSLPLRQAQTLSQKVYYVTSQKDPQERAKLLKTASHVIKPTVTGDGLVDQTEMYIPGFGKIIGSMYADHMELVVPPMLGLNTSTIEKNKAFVLALVKNILKEINTKSSKARFCKEAFLAIYNQG